MFLIYKIVIVVLSLSVLFYYFGVPFVYLYIIAVIIVHNEENFHCFIWNCISKFCLKVRVQKSQVKIFSHSTTYSKNQHSTPIMQISYMNTSKSSYSPTLNSESRSRLFNGVTSTPLSSPTSHIKNSLFLPNKLSPLRSPPMYSLSEVSNSSKSQKPVQNVSGPLLASTRFNVSLGTYADTKSPGLTNRIVQYSNEAKQKQTPTHQLKYGSPGLFPVVHFFKQDIPTISPKQRKVTVKIASPDTSWYNSPAFIAKKIGSKSPSLQNGHDISHSSADTETRSVLDALKEISRKRINTSTDFEPDQDPCKRQKRCEKNLSIPESNKRVREESPVAESSNKNSIQPSAKKVCVVDLVAASFTSSQLFQEQIHKGLKKNVELENMETMDNKSSHLLTVSTQTTEVKITKIRDAAEQTDTKETDIRELRESKTPKSRGPEEELRYANIFDPNKLEVNRKNKLAMLLSAVTGEPPTIIPYEKPKVTPLSEELQIDNTFIQSAPKLVSILSPQNKPKHDKHVTFNLPSEESNSTETVSVTTKEVIASESSSSVAMSTAISTPIKDKSPSVDTINNTETPKSVLPTPTVTKLNFGLHDASTISKEDKKLDIANKTEENKTSKAETIGFAFKPLIQTSTTTSVPTFSFGTQNTTPTNASSSIISFASAPHKFTPPTNTSISPKPAGFQFDLTKSPNDVKTTAGGTVFTSASTSPDASKLLFGTNQIITSSTSELKPASKDMFKTVQTSVPLMPTFGFGEDKSLSNTQSNISNVPVITSTMFSAASPGNIPKTSVTLSSTLLPFASPSQDFNFGNSNPKQIGSFPVITSQSATTPMFASSNTLTFGSPQPGQISTSNAFSAPLVSSPAFGVQSSTTPFGIQSTNLATSSAFGTGPTIQTTNSVFGSIPSSNTPSFALSNTNSIAATTTATPTFSNTQGFCNAVTTSVNATGFGVPKTTPSFGTPTGPLFGGSTTSSPFTSTSGFGSNTTGIPTFGATTSAEKSFNTSTTSSSMFVTNPANQTFNTTTTTSSSGFGTNLGNKPFTFGSSNNNNNATFNAPNPAPTFNFTATTSSNNTFTSKSIPSFGATFTTSNIFGSSTTQTPSTTSATTGIFKSPTSTFGNPQFGSKPENTFGTKTENSAFGTKTESNAFGTKTENNAFGTKTENNAFGTKTENTAFGTKPENNTFGTKPENNAFGAKSENNTFGTYNSTFGSSNNTSAFGKNASTTNTFGTNANPSTFGTTNNPSTFGTAPNSSTFGQAPNSSGFGTNVGSSGTFGSNTNNNVNTFGVAPNVGGTFGANPNNNTMFGAASNTTNNTFGSNTNNNAFGSGFGSTNTTAPTFGFNSGENSSAFSKPQAPTGAFGNAGSGDTAFQFASNTNQGFGAGNTTVATSSAPSSVFAFGGTNSTSTPAAGIFTFGSSDKPSFNFNTGTNANPAFSAGVPAFNTGSAPTFNPATPPPFVGAGVFNIGSGSSSGGRSRTQMKNKRRT